jgi:hypothetical protein
MDKLNPIFLILYMRVGSFIIKNILTNPLFLVFSPANVFQRLPNLTYKTYFRIAYTLS